MSRIGKQLIEVPADVTVTINGDVVNVTGPKGSLNLNLPQHIKVSQKANQIAVERFSEIKKARSNHGTIRARLSNMVTGVVTPFKKELEIRGTGYKASVSGNKLTVNAGFIHPVNITAPAGVEFQVKDETLITVFGPDKITVGQVASNIRKIRTPEPYKGKGIRYLNEFIKLKAGKTAKA